MIEDEVMRGVWAAKDAFARRFNYDIDAMGAYLREQQEKSGRSVVRLAPRRPTGWVEPESDQPMTTTKP